MPACALLLGWLVDQPREPGRNVPWRSLSALIAVLVLVVPTSARADEDEEDQTAEEATPSAGTVTTVMPPLEPNPHRHWQPHWARFDGAGVVLLATAEGAAFAVYLAEPITTPRWIDRLPGDDEIRSGLRFNSADDRQTAVVVSDVMLYSFLAWPVLVDAILLAGVVHGDEDAALQMALIDAEVLAVAHMVTWLTSRLAGRVRPEALECAPAGTCVDRGSGPVDSFVGGHTIMAYAAAGLVCVHHFENPWLTGSYAGATMACAGGLALTTGMSFLRIEADRHWASDITFGALMGAALGFGLPYVLSYGRARLPPELRQLSLRPGTDAGGPLGLTVAGAF
jgi:membrane-associated phospholipid phosphatase